jgi:hypothetical protein
MILEANYAHVIICLNSFRLRREERDFLLGSHTGGIDACSARGSLAWQPDRNDKAASSRSNLASLGLNGCKP